MEHTPIVVVPSEDHVAEVRSGVEDLAFDAAAGIAQISDIELASDEFNELYRELIQRYSAVSEYLLYFLHLGVLSLKTQMETGLVHLRSPKSEADQQADVIADCLLNAAKPIAACLLHCAAVGDKMLIPDVEIHQMSGGVLNLAVDFNLAGFTIPGDTNNGSII